MYIVQDRVVSLLLYSFNDHRHSTLSIWPDHFRYPCQYYSAKIHLSIPLCWPTGATENCFLCAWWYSILIDKSYLLALRVGSCILVPHAQQGSEECRAVGDNVNAYTANATTQRKHLEQELMLVQWWVGTVSFLQSQWYMLKWAKIYSGRAH